MTMRDVNWYLLLYRNYCVIVAIVGYPRSRARRLANDHVHPLHWFSITIITIVAVYYFQREISVLHDAAAFERHSPSSRSYPPFNPRVQRIYHRETNRRV